MARRGNGRIVEDERLNMTSQLYHNYIAQGDKRTDPILDCEKLSVGWRSDHGYEGAR